MHTDSIDSIHKAPDAQHGQDHTAWPIGPPGHLHDHALEQHVGKAIQGVIDARAMSSVRDVDKWVLSVATTNSKPTSAVPADPVEGEEAAPTRAWKSWALVRPIETGHARRRCVIVTVCATTCGRERRGKDTQKRFFCWYRVGSGWLSESPRVTSRA